MFVELFDKINALRAKSKARPMILGTALMFQFVMGFACATLVMGSLTAWGTGPVWFRFVGPLMAVGTAYVGITAMVSPPPVKPSKSVDGPRHDQNDSPSDEGALTDSNEVP